MSILSTIHHKSLADIFVGTAKEKKEILGVTVEANERIFLDIYAANTNVSDPFAFRKQLVYCMQEKTFPNPCEADPSRDKKPAFYADGLHKSLGEPLTTKVCIDISLTPQTDTNTDFE